MHLFYIDDSRDQTLCAFSALCIPATSWKDAFAVIRQFRHDLKRKEGIFVYKEFHATDFVAGRGRLAARTVPKGARCRIFKETLQLITQLPGAHLFNAVLPINRTEWAFERLLNRINRTMTAWDSQAILICDEGKEAVYTRLARRMGIYNPIPSQFGVWPNPGGTWKNIPLDRIIEDPIFKESRKSYFVQFADFCAFALLRMENPIPARTKYGLDQAFNILAPICFQGANLRDPKRLGIVR